MRPSDADELGPAGLRLELLDQSHATRFRRQSALVHGSPCRLDLNDNNINELGICENCNSLARHTETANILDFLTVDFPRKLPMSLI